MQVYIKKTIKKEELEKIINEKFLCERCKSKIKNGLSKYCLDCWYEIRRIKNKKRRWLK